MLPTKFDSSDTMALPMIGTLDNKNAWTFITFSICDDVSKDWV